MASDQSSSETAPYGWPAWVKEGEVLAVDGSTEKILKVTPDQLYVVTWTSWATWPLSSFLTALASGRVTRPGAKTRVRRTVPPPSASAVTRSPRLPDRHDLSDLPVPMESPAAAVKSVLHSLQAIRRGSPIDIPDAAMLHQLAVVGADADGLGPPVAVRKGRVGRMPLLQPEAERAQTLLAKFRCFLFAGGDFTRNELSTVEVYIDLGLEAYRLIEASPRPTRGRPGSQNPKIEAVRRLLSRNWHDFKRGKYSAHDAIREVAAGEILHRKQVSAAWDGADYTRTRLCRDDEEDVARAFQRIERAYHRAGKLTAADVATYRRDIAAQYRFARRWAKTDFCQ